MFLSRLFGAIGPLLAAIGAGMLAYDVLRNPLRATYNKLISDGINSRRSIYTRLIERYNALPATLDQFTVKRWITETEEMMRQDRESSEAKRLEFELAEARSSQRIGLWGFSLLALGSFLQMTASLLH